MANALERNLSKFNLWVRNLKLLTILWILLLGSVSWNLYSKGITNFEVLQTTTTLIPDGKPSERLFGGYARKYWKGFFGYTSIHIEAEAEFMNAGEVGAKIPNYRNSHANERFYASSFLPGVGISALRLDPMVAYLLTNIFLWALSILLAYRIGVQALGGKPSGLIFAMFIASFFVFTLMFRSLKIQYAGCVYFLLGIWLYETYWIRSKVTPQLIIGSLAFWIIGRFCATGYLYVGLYLLARFINDVIRHDWRVTARPAFVLSLTFALSKIPSELLLSASHLRSASQEWHIDMNVMNTVRLVRAWLAGRDLTEHYMFSVPSEVFLGTTIPFLLKGYAEMCWPFLIFSVPLFFLRRTHWMIVLAALLFPIGQIAILISGWGAFHYSYLSGPSAIMLMMGCALLAGELVLNRQRTVRWAVIGCLIAVLGWMNSHSLTKLNYYYGNEVSAYRFADRIFEDSVEMTSEY